MKTKPKSQSLSARRSSPRTSSRSLPELNSSPRTRSGALPERKFWPGTDGIPRTPFSFGAITPVVGTVKSVSLSDWWLTKKTKEKGFGIAGFESEGGSVVRRLFSSGTISKRHDSATVETFDGITVSISGFINRSRTLQNGISSEICNRFLLGFPYNWKDYDEQGSVEEKKKTDFSISFNDIPVSRLQDLLLTSSPCFKSNIFDDVVYSLRGFTCPPKTQKSDKKCQKSETRSLFSVGRGEEENEETGEASAYVADSERAGRFSVDQTCSSLGTESRFDASGISVETKEEIGNLENRDGTMVDLTALTNYAEEPYGEELRRITLGLKTKEDLLGFLEQLNGEWVNSGKKKKVVEASDFGGYFPRGWKLMLCIKKQGSNLWLACRNYISPDGQQFETCKEVSTYLQSRSKNHLNFLQSDNKTLGQPVMANKSLVGNSDSIDLPDLNLETNKNLEGKRSNSDDDKKRLVPMVVGVKTRGMRRQREDNEASSSSTGERVHAKSKKKR